MQLMASPVPTLGLKGWKFLVSSSTGTFSLHCGKDWCRMKILTHWCLFSICSLWSAWLKPSVISSPLLIIFTSVAEPPGFCLASTSAPLLPKCIRRTGLYRQRCSFSLTPLLFLFSCGSLLPCPNSKRSQTVFQKHC